LRPPANLTSAFDDAASDHTAGSEGINATLLRELVEATKRPRSTIQVKADVAWPTLTDNDHDVEQFFDDLDDVCGLANDAQGMNEIERLRVLGNCLKQSRKKVYRVELKKGRVNGVLRSNPGKIYEEVRDRLMEFRETTLERQNRVENEYNNLQKGSLKALQFLPLFESSIGEMDLCGVGLSERQLLLGYLRKVGAQYRTDILKDKRLYPNPGGPDEMRAARTWREAHRILLEMESISAGSKVLVAALDAPDGNATGRPKRPKSKKAEGTPKINALSLEGHRICYRARDNGTCDVPGCKFEHDKPLLELARKEKAKKEAGQDRPRGGKGNGAGKTDK